MNEKLALDIPGQTAAISKEQLRTFVLENNGLRPCEFCGSDAWHFPEDPDGLPSLRFSQSVRDGGIGDWNFPVICLSCGNTKSLAAGVVWNHFHGDVE